MPRVIGPYGLKCASLDEFKGWFKLAVLVRKVSGKPTNKTAILSDFCADGEPSWCSQMRADGRCIRWKGAPMV